MLNAVLACLDTIAQDESDTRSRMLAFAAIRVQEAIDLIAAPNMLDS